MNNLFWKSANLLAGRFLTGSGKEQLLTGEDAIRVGDGGIGGREAGPSGGIAEKMSGEGPESVSVANVER
jgi:hypothetical protein